MNYRILLVEDSLADAELFQELLAHTPEHHFHVEAAERLSSALGLLNTAPFDLVILDLGLPDSQGLETFSRLQARVQHIPVIVLTGWDDETAAARAVSLGAQDYLVKNDLTGPLLVKAIRYAIERKRVQETLRIREETLRTLVSNIPDVVLRFDRELHVRFANPAAKALLPQPPVDLMDKKLSDLGLPAEIAALGERSIRQVFETGAAVEIEFDLETLDGRQYFRTSLVPERGADGSVAQALVIARNFTAYRRNQDALAESQARYQELFENAQDIIYTLNMQGEVTSINRTGEHVLGFPREELIGLRLDELADDLRLDREEVRQMWAQATNATTPAESAVTFELVVRDKHGKLIPLEASTRLIFRDGMAVGVQGIARDMTSRKALEAALRESERFARSTVDALSAHIAILDETGRIIAANQAWLDFAHENDAPGDAQSYIGSNYLAVCDLAQGDDSAEADAVAAGIRSVIAGEQSSFELEYPCHAPTEQRWFVARVTRFPGDGPLRIVVAHENITERKLAELATRQYASRLELLHEIDRAILRADQPQPLAQAVLAALQSLLGCHSASITLFDFDNDNFTVLATTAAIPPERAAGTKHPLEDRAIYSLLAQNKPYTVADTFVNTSPYLTNQAFVAAGIRSYAQIPMITGGKLIGALNLRAVEPAAFSADMLAVAGEVAAQLGVALENARLLEIEQRRSSELTALHQASLQLTSSLDLETVLDTILDHAILLVRAIAAHIYLYDGETLTFGAAYWDEEKQNRPYADPRPHGLNYSVARSGQRVVIPNVHAHPTYAQFDWAGAMVGLPLRVADEVNGVMSLVFAEPHDFDEHEIRFLELLADQAALAIHNAQLYARIQQYADQLEQRVEERTTQLEHVKDRVEAILSSTSDGVILMDQHGNLIQANPAFEEQFGQKAEFLFKKPLARLIAESSGNAFMSALHNAVTTQQRVRCDVQCHRGDGALFEAEFAIAPLINNWEDEIHLVCVVHDITQRKHTEASLRSALAQEKELSELKTRFISMVSHDFRTPLTVIQSSAEILQAYHDRLDEQRKTQHFSKIRTQIQRMVQMLNDVLTISRADAGALTVNLARVNLNRFCQELAEEFQSAPGMKHHLVYRDLDGPEAVLVDEKLLQQALINLLTNAFKYSPEGSTVYFDLSYDNADAVIEIKDSGIGIPEADQGRLFEMFHRAGNVGTIQGTGLGLAIVKRSVDAHGGSIAFVSQENAGTTFTIRIPQRQQPAKQAGIAEEGRC